MVSINISSMDDLLKKHGDFLHCTRFNYQKVDLGKDEARIKHGVLSQRKEVAIGTKG